MKSVRLFDFIQFDGVSWQVVAQDGTELALKNLSTGRIRRVPVAGLLSDDSYLPDDPPLPCRHWTVSRLSRRSSPVPGHMRCLHRHVYELLNGTPPDAAPERRPSPNTTSPTRLQPDRGQGGRARRRGHADRARTMHRHVAAYRSARHRGLADGRNTRQMHAGRLGRPGVLALLEAEVAGRPMRPRDPVPRHHPSPGPRQEQGLTVPSRRHALPDSGQTGESRHPFGNATTRRTQASRPDRTWGRQRPCRPGELVEIDSSPLDLMLIYPDGTSGHGRPHRRTGHRDPDAAGRDPAPGGDQSRRRRGPAGQGHDSPADAARLGRSP